MSRKTLLWLGAAAAAIVVVSGGTWLARDLRARRAWAAARPPVPDLAGWPAEFRARVAAENARAAHWPPDPAAMGDLGALYLANGFSDQAEACLRAACRCDRAGGRWPHLLGCLLAGNGRVQEGLPFLQAAVACNPGDVPARLRVGDILLKTDRAEEAAAAYREVLKIAPTDPYAMRGLARVDIAAGRWSAARIQLEAAARANPAFPEIFSMLAAVYERGGNTERALESRRRAEELGRFRDVPDPTVEDLWQICYDIYRLQVVAGTRLATREVVGAQPVLERALKLAPDDPGVLRQLGNLKHDLGDLAAARKYLEQAVSGPSAEPGAYLDLIAVYNAQNDFAAKSRILDQALQRFPQEAGLHFERGIEHAGAGRFEAAAASFQTVIRLAPERAGAYYQLALVLFRLGRPDEAAAALENALAREPDFGPGLLALIHYRITQHDAAAAAALFARARHEGLNGTAFIEQAQDYERVFGQPPPEPPDPTR